MVAAEDAACSSEEDGEEDEQIVREYIGSLDDAGRFHGRATVHYDSGDTFRGRFAHGLRDGRGTMEFEDGSTQTGRYINDELEGTAVYAFPSGENIVAQYVHGLMQGPFRELNSEGFVACSGTMLDGVRTGQIQFCYPDGGELRGIVDDNGAVTGEDWTYLYPDGSGLCGRWEDGEMAAAVFRTAAEMAACKHGSSQPAPPKKQRCDEGPLLLLRYDPGTAKRISRDPLLQDHYEAVRVEAKRSRIPNANEGLFARRPLEQGEVACFYAGVRINHELVDGRDWADNENTLSIDDETVIDVPQRWISTSAYCATLGHKANHSFAPNSRYEPYNHPRFGEIKCIRCTRDVGKGEEITCHYDYNEIGDDGRLVAPDWFLALPGSDKIGR